MVQQTQNKTNKPMQNKTNGQKERKSSDEKRQQGAHGVLSLEMASVCMILYIIPSINWALNQRSKTLKKKNGAFLSESALSFLWHRSGLMM